VSYQSFKYISIALGGTSKRRNVIKWDMLELPFSPIDCFRSWCKYDEEYLDYWKAHNGSVSGFAGKVDSSFIPFDIDNDELEKSHKTAKDFIGILEWVCYVPSKAISTYFSGSKGFHIEIPTILFGNIQPSSELPLQFKHIAKSFGFEDFDTKIYHRNALWRLPNTINSKTDLYKIPLTICEIRDLSIEELMVKALKPVTSYNICPYDEWNPNEHLVRLWEKSAKKVVETKRYVSVKDMNSLTINELNFQGVKTGVRNKTAFMIARSLKSKGFKTNEAKEYIVKWNLKNDPPEEDIISLYRTVESAYSYDISDSGSIELTKHLRSDPYFNSLNSDQKAVYIYLITHFNEIEKTVWNKFQCKPNQLIFSYRSLAINAGVSEQTVRALIKKLRKSGRISVETLLGDSGNPECSRLTFHCFSLTHPSNTPKPDEKPSKLTHLSNNY